ncbi:MAG: FIST N-terminal domain-containing protein [Pseudomonadota bacterium]
MSAWRAAHGAGPDVAAAARACAESLGSVGGAGLGVFYVTDAAAYDVAAVGALLADTTGVDRWIGGVGVGVAAAGPDMPATETHYDEIGVVAMTLPIPADRLRLFHAADEDGLDRSLADAAAWSAVAHPGLAVVHADPRAEAAAAVIEALAMRAGVFTIGCFTAAPSLMGLDDFDDDDDEDETEADDETEAEAEEPLRLALATPEIVDEDDGDDIDAGVGAPDQVAGDAFAGMVSGVLIGGALEIATGLTQGCAPIGPMRPVTRSEGNVVIEIDGRPALEVLLEDGGAEIANDLRRLGGRIYLAKAVAGGAARDYLVRNLLAVDPQHGWVAIGDMIEDGDHVAFAKRDRESAVDDMRAMLADLTRRAGKPPLGALYHSCAARGPNMFDAELREIDLIREAFPETPVIGVFGNGEISQGRVYGYTGVLTLFL